MNKYISHVECKVSQKIKYLFVILENMSLYLNICQNICVHLLLLKSLYANFYELPHTKDIYLKCIIHLLRNYEFEINF